MIRNKIKFMSGFIFVTLGGFLIIIYKKYLDINIIFFGIFFILIGIILLVISRQRIIDNNEAFISEVPAIAIGGQNIISGGGR